MAEDKVDQIYSDHLANLPENERSFVRSLIVSLMAARFELTDVPKAVMAWGINAVFQQEELNNSDKDGVFNRAVMLTTLPVSDNEKTEWYYRWLRGNGLTILQDESMRDLVIARLDDTIRNKASLVAALDTLLDTRVDGLQANDLSEVPEAFSLFATFLVCFNCYTPEMTGERARLFEKATKKLIEDNECNRVMDLFGDDAEIKDLYEKFRLAREFCTY